MALITCPECGKEVSSLAQNCIHCGCPLQNLTQQNAQTNEVSPVAETTTQRPVSNTPTAKLEDLNKQFKNQTALSKTTNILEKISDIVPIVILIFAFLAYQDENFSTIAPVLLFLIFVSLVVGVVSAIIDFALKINANKRFDNWIKNNNLNLLSTYKADILNFLEKTPIDDDNICTLYYLSTNPQEIGKNKAGKVLLFISRLISALVTSCIFLYAITLASTISSISVLIPLLLPCLLAYIPSITLYIIFACLAFPLEKRAKNWYTQQIQNV